MRTISVQVRDSLYREMQQIAARSKTSINALLNQASTEVVQEVQDQEMAEAAALLGYDVTMTDVEFAFDAESKAVNSNT